MEDSLCINVKSKLSFGKCLNILLFIAAQLNGPDFQIPLHNERLKTESLSDKIFKLVFKLNVQNIIVDIIMPPTCAEL